MNELITIEAQSPRPADQNPAAVYLAGLSEGTSRRTMLGALEQVARYVSQGRFGAMDFPWQGLRYQHVQAIRSHLANTMKHTTANKVLAALRGVLRAAWRLGLMDAEDYQRAADVPCVRGESLPAGRAVSHAELRALMEACKADQSPKGTRDAAIIALMYGCGLRRAEVIGLDLADYDQGEGTLRVQGKGRKQRLCHVTNGAARALTAWLRTRGKAAGPLFLPVTKAGDLQWRRMTTQAVYYILARRAKEAGVEHLSPHDLRRSFVSDLLDMGADIVTVQRLAGHAQVTTTARYDRRGEAAKRQAAAMLRVPF
ncbi:tyrosine-type recombinase/integrase [Desulfosoma caldarium]|uniref:Site-specific recombinase XerD n=1 Tax=Desulfosoma caldarium TaxID=610254 RepID=A0A3N1VKQ7_9BACT|nr:tyrosine-type recombinase/integrase [Desulfosoma caldarium]ROR03386.1 site-specific recombinase XerD [Desulfosoma caldarium]